MLLAPADWAKEIVMILLPLVYLFFLVLIGAWARNRGRSFVIWSVLALVLTPLVAAILLLILPTRDRGAVAKLTGVMDGWTATLRAKTEEIKAQKKEEAERHAFLDAQLRANTADARINQMVADRARQLAATPAPAAPTNSGPTFGKRNT